jgi:hypothetical protein
MLMPGGGGIKSRDFFAAAEPLLFFQSLNDQLRQRVAR